MGIRERLDGETADVADMDQRTTTARQAKHGAAAERAQAALAAGSIDDETPRVRRSALAAGLGGQSADRASPVPPPVQRAPRPANARKPFGAQEQKLQYAARPGYRRYWFNDEPGRVDRAKEAGYSHVDEKGRPVQRVVGKQEGGAAQIAFLMEIPSEWYEEDMAAEQAKSDETMAAIRRGDKHPVENGYVDTSRTRFR